MHKYARTVEPLYITCHRIKDQRVLDVLISEVVGMHKHGVCDCDCALFIHVSLFQDVSNTGFNSRSIVYNIIATCL